jgi:hypothetical protein
VVHVDGTVDPDRDVEVIEIELVMADLSVAQKHLDRVQAKMKAGRTKELEAEESLLQRILGALSDGKPARSVEMTDEEQELARLYQLLTMKPVLYVVNVGEDQISNPPDVLKGRQKVFLSVKIESEIVEMPAEEQKNYLEMLGLTQSGVDRLITESFRLLDLITYLTSGEKETRAWTITKGTKTPQAAGVIHTDFERGFIRAEIIDWKDFVELGEVGAKNAGKMRIEGKDYVMKDGDVCHFRISVS